MKILKYILIALPILLIGIAVFYLGPRLPVITGFAAKNMCSCVYLGERDAANVAKEELGSGLLALANTTVNEAEKTVTSTVYGFGKQVAIYREGLGCTLVADGSLEDLRKQTFAKADTALSYDPDTLLFPYGNQMVDTFPEGIDQQKLNAFLDAQFDKGEEIELGTRALLVVYKGQIIAEQYGKGYDKDKRQLGWSMAKSVTNAMFGLRVGDSKLSVNAVPDIPIWQADERKKIKNDDLLKMSSGLDWGEVYTDLSDATLMLYKKGDMYTFACGAEAFDIPGPTWYYSSGTSNILAGLIHHTFDDQNEYWNYPYQRLFSKINMSSAVFEPDVAGTFVGSSYVWATPRDWARFGLLYMYDGIWNNERILPSGWVGYSTMDAAGSKGEYGAQIWLNRGGALPDAPHNMFYFRGYQGQRVFVLPDQDLVVVRLGIKGDNEYFNEVLKGIIELTNNR